MINQNAHYEINGGNLLVNGDPVPLRKGMVYVTLARAGWDGHEGLLPPKIVESMFELDQRISLMALSLKAQPGA
jgi:hypothetical protein